MSPAPDFTPMSPQARALNSMWLAVWDAPRFRSERPGLQKEAVAPLLKVAASCASALLEEVAQGSGASQLTAYGASREVLVAALDGEPAGAPLSDPSADPEGFVRALAKACFMTGDGELVQGLTHEQLDGLLSERCAAELRLARSLASDPGAALQTALEAATAAVAKVVVSPVKAGDLQSVSARLLLAQRLERLAEEAKTLLEEAAPEQAAGESSPTNFAAADHPMEEEDACERQEAEHLDATEAGDAAAGEVLERTTTVAQGVAASLAAEEAADRQSGQGLLAEAAQELERTKSQIAASVKVTKVTKHIEEATEPLYDLKRAVSQLAKRGVPADEELHALQSELEAVEQAQKRARNFQEDLVQDMLALDGLSNLNPADRPARKAAIAGLESLLDDVDTASRRLSALQQQLRAKAAEAKAAKSVVVEETKQESVPVAAPKTARVQTPARDRANGKALQVPLPKHEDWQKLRLPLRFNTQEAQDGYVVSASVPGLDTELLKLELSEDNSTLTVQGLRVPTVAEATRMQQKISARLRLLAQQQPQSYARLHDSIEQVASQAYMELGQDSYGRFSQKFTIPEDVNVAGIDASYRDGVLRVVLPKIVSAPAAMRTRGGYYAPPSRGGYPTPASGFSSSRRTPRPAANLFGGFDDNFFW